MITVRKADGRGHANHGWLDTWHSFSFADYYDPQHMGFRTLRVINDDVIDGGGGFPPHPHRDMEIVTYVIDGALEHKDSMGNGGVLRPGDIQYMTAGKGVTHSEFNHSESEKLRLLQIWIQPDATGREPGYRDLSIPEAEKRGQLRLIASPDGSGESLKIHQDLRLYASLLDAGEEVEYELRTGRAAWIQVANGELSVNGVRLSRGDGAAIEDEEKLKIEGKAGAEFLLFDLK